MILPVFAIIFGLILLVWSSDRFVDGALGVSTHAGLSPLLIGILVMGFGTSAPELLVSATAALKGRPAIALGNAYGSNIANIALVLGMTALLGPILVKSRIIKKELPVLLLITVAPYFLLKDGMISRWDGGLHLLAFVILLGLSIWEGKREKKDADSETFDLPSLSSQPSLMMSLFTTVLGLLLLVLSSQILVWGAVEVAKMMGVSDLIIGLTIVAVGTSMPELAASLMATKKGEHDLVLGNILGSNLFNTLGVVGLAGSIHPIEAGNEVLTRDYPLMVALTLFIYILTFKFLTGGKIGRLSGAVLVTTYFIYLGALVYSGANF